MAAAAVAWHVLKRLPLPVIAASAAGWLLLAGAGMIPVLPPLCGSVGRGGDIVGVRVATALSLAPSVLVLEWLVMILAMMPPLLAASLRHVRQRSFPRRRPRALALFALGYGLVWLASGAPLVAALLVLGDAASSTGIPRLAMAGLVALAWQATPLKQKFLNGCHRQPPLAAFGFRADRDALSFGAIHGLWCAGTCWALMLLPFSATGACHWSMMALVMLVTLVERARAPDAPRWRVGWRGGCWSAAGMPERRLA